MTKLKVSTPASLLAMAFDRMFNYISGEYDDPRSYINKADAARLMGCTDSNGDETLTVCIKSFAGLLNIPEGEFKNALTALRFRNTPVGLRIDSHTKLLLIAFNPKSETAAYFVPGHDYPNSNMPIPVKMIDSSGHLYPDFEYDQRLRNGYLPFVYNTETKTWSRLRYTTSWVEKSVLGDSLPKASSLSEVDTLVMQMVGIDHGFEFISKMEDETSLLFTELAVSTAVSLITGFPQRLNDLANTDLFISQRPIDWSSIITGLKRIFPEDAVTFLTDKRTNGLPVDINQIGRIRFIAKCNMPLFGDEAETTVEKTMEMLEAEGSFVLVNTGTIVVCNRAINDFLLTTGMPNEKISDTTYRWFITGLAIPAKEPEIKIAEGEQMSDKLKTANIENRLTRKVILTMLMQVMGGDVTFLNKEEVAALNNMRPSDLRESMHGQALKFLQSEVWPRMGTEFFAHQRYVELKEDRIPGIMSLTHKGAGVYTAKIWECDNPTEVRTVETNLPTVMNTVVVAMDAGSLLINLDGTVGLVDTEARIQMDYIRNDHFVNNIQQFLSKGIFPVDRDSSFDPNKSTVSEVLRESTRERFAEEQARLEGIGKAMSNDYAPEHDYHVDIGEAVISCLRAYGKDSIGEAQLVWVQEALARKLVMPDEIGLAEGETILKSEGRWFFAKEV